MHFRQRWFDGVKSKSGSGSDVRGGDVHRVHFEIHTNYLCSEERKMFDVLRGFVQIIQTGGW